MSAVARFELILLLMAAVVVLEVAARRLRLPPAAALIVGGILLALIPTMPRVSLDPDLALVLFLPPLLVSDAFLTSWRDFRANLRIILQLAIGAVVFTTLIIGVVAHAFFPSLPWGACFALGAIVSPPDAVAAKAVLEQVNLPRRVVVLLEGESLINDASGLLLYRLAVAATLTGTFSLAQAAIGFVVLPLGGIVIGVAAGYAGSFLFGKLPERNLAVVASLLLSWATYICADALSVSGVIATVACGLVLGWRQHETLSAETRIAATVSWQFVTFMLESLVFILIGLSLRDVIERLGGSFGGFGDLIVPILAVVAAVVLSRFAWVIPTAYLTRAMSSSLRRRDPYPPISVPIVISWAGMRGVVSLAAALALPINFPGRDLIIATTFAVILVTVLVQGSTLAPLIRIARVQKFQGLEGFELGAAETRARVAQAELRAIQRISATEDGRQRHPRLLEQYTYRAQAAERYSAAEIELRPHREEHFSAVLAAVQEGRAELVQLHRRGEIHDSVLRALETELDLEETAARRNTTES